MLRANLLQIFIVDNSYQNRVDFFKGQNHSFIDISDKFLLFTKDNGANRFELTFHEEDMFTKTFLSEFDDGAPFRVIRPIGVSKEMSLLQNNSKDGFSVSSVNPDGYSLIFMLTEKNDIRNIQIKIKGVEEQLQKLATGAMMALQHNLQNDFYNILRRLIAGVNANKKDIHQLDNGSTIAKILKDNFNSYDEIEQRKIAKM